MSDKSYISVDNMTFYRGERVIFERLNLDIERGKITAILGPSGIGKTTLLKLIGGQLLPDSGRVVVEGNDLSELNRRACIGCGEKWECCFSQGLYSPTYPFLTMWPFLFESIPSLMRN